MILIADSGSTKTTWRTVGNGVTINEITTTGINPYLRTEDDIALCIADEVVPYLDAPEFDAVYFYGAGCVFDKAGVVERAITRTVKAQTIAVNTDLLGAARALCGDEAGIACILGTGSNSCFYDGSYIVRNIPPLGFILGDEGGGADLGKRLVGDIMKEIMPEHITEEFFSQTGLSLPEIMDRVYRQPYPNRFLAGLSSFMEQRLHEPHIRKLVTDSFRSFFERNIVRYDYRKYTAHFTGSVAFRYKDILREVAGEAGVRIGAIVASPMDGMASYHLKHRL